MRGNLQIFTTRSMHEYTHNVIETLYGKKDYSNIHDEDIRGNLTVTRFADGEIEVETKSSVRGNDVYLFAGAAARNSYGLSVDENKIEIYHAVDALRRAQADRITLFEPYCSAGRSDRTTRRNSVGLWVHYKTLISLGVDHIITYNLHSDKSRSIIDPSLCAIDDIPVLFLLKQYIADTYIKTCERLENEIGKNWVFCSVDAGGEVLAKKFASAFNTPLVISHKQRDYSCANKVVSTHILSGAPLSGKIVWVIDDMIDTGGSMEKLVTELAAHDVKEINVAVVHPVLSGPAIERLGALMNEGLLARLVFTDSVYCDQKLLQSIPSATVVNSHELAASIIYNLNQELSLSHFFEPFNVHTHFECNCK